MDITRTTLLDASPDEVREALTDPELLSAWLGPWSDDTVVTDDGVTRSVRRTESGWIWWPEGDESSASEVVYTIVPEDGRTRLTITETAGAIGWGGVFALASLSAVCV